MPTDRDTTQAVFRVLDAMDAPHRGRILRLRLQSGDAPSIRDLKGARMAASPPDGDTERFFRIDGFAVFGGKASDERLARTGRIDVHAFMEDDGEGAPIALQWQVRGPLAS